MPLFPTLCVPMGSPPFEFPGSGDPNPQVALNYILWVCRLMGMDPEDIHLLASAFTCSTVNPGAGNLVIFFRQVPEIPIYA